MKSLNIRSRFKVGTGLILFVFCAGVSLLVYQYGKNRIEEEAHKETEFFISAVEASSAYVHEVLRPKMYEILPEDHFIIEAMSTAFVGRKFMESMHNRFKDFRYKRASKIPMNPLNLADTLELKIIEKFNTDPDLVEWSGIVEKDDQAFYARFRAIPASGACMRCHGIPEQLDGGCMRCHDSEPVHSPPNINEKYGSDRKGFGYQVVGTVVAADSVYIPVDFYFAKIKRQAWMTFFIGGGVLFLSIVLFYTLFNYTVVSELKGLLTIFKRIGSKEEPGDTINKAEDMDEIGQLKQTFENTASDLAQTHNELQESESKYRRLFETSRDPIFICSIHSKLLDINAAGIRMFQFIDKETALSIETVEQLFFDTQNYVGLIECLRKDGFINAYEVSLVNRSGDHLYGLVTANLFTDEQGQPAGFEGVIRDITDKKRMEKHLARTEKLVAVGQLAAGLAHEINTPLGVIDCYANLVKKSAGDNTSIKDDVETIQKHTLNCKRIVEDLLNFARVSNTRKVKGDILQTIEGVVKIMKKQALEKGIKVSRHYADDLPEVAVDMDKMSQVFMNLIINAIQAIRQNGHILVEVDLSEDAKYIKIRIKDTGPGIPQSQVNSIFDPFFTTKKPGKGTGLGLSISYGIIHEHGGDIQVQSSHKKGTVFTITLPIGE